MYGELSKGELSALKEKLSKEYEALKSKGLKLDMSRGKPSSEQLDLSNAMMKIDLGDYKTDVGFDCRNYGALDGINETKRFLMPLLGVEEECVFIGGNSSLQLMYDAIARAMLFGTPNAAPWGKNGSPVKFLCPSPGYDRHFTMLEAFGIEMITVPMLESGPDMDMVEKLAAEDKNIKGIFCVPMYSNPCGITYSDETVRRFAALKTAAFDFRIFWDNAYCVHHLTDAPEKLLNIYDECVKHGNENKVYIFVSTSKITFAGGGISAIGSSPENTELARKQLALQTIGFDRINQLRHARFFKDLDGLNQHMEKHRAIVEPKFNVVFEALEREILPVKLGEWHKPRGGYFVSFNGLKGTAKRVVELCKQAGVVLTGAGATFPYGADPLDRNIRIAPTFPPESELVSAMEVFCAAVKLASAEVLSA
ncbi:MAG: aminotransferase class I/II-fold pyridoxal phosphate-dependent enzyme [Oscillospiraceae bacterium]|nr:aminotransferase class I/II-fold pyridoxal phosphate-dependent enzyme [Oscillospiraceae bacterium]